MGNHDERPRSFPTPLRWIPEFLELGKKCLRSQARLFGATILVGIVAGLGAVLFYVMCQVVLNFALDVCFERGHNQPFVNPARRSPVIRYGHLRIKRQSNPDR